MANLFNQAIAQADDIIANVIFEPWLINGVEYQACLDEGPKIFDGLQTSDDLAIKGTEKSLSLYRSSGYRPRPGDRVKHKDNERHQYLVKSYYFEDDLIIMRLE